MSTENNSKQNDDKMLSRLELRWGVVVILVSVVVLSLIIGWWSSSKYTPSNIQPLKKSAQIVAMSINPEHYNADSCIVCCIDDRFTPMIDRFADKNGYKKVDMIKVAGGAKDFAKDNYSKGAPNDVTIQQYLCKQVAKSIELHHTKRVDIMIHTNCGAFGGTNDEAFSLKELSMAKSAIEQYLKNAGYEVPVYAYLATFEGLYEAN